jgi:hypothetical protein
MLVSRFWYVYWKSITNRDLEGIHVLCTPQALPQGVPFASLHTQIMRLENTIPLITYAQEITLENYKAMMTYIDECNKKLGRVPAPPKPVFKLHPGGKNEKPESNTPSDRAPERQAGQRQDDDRDPAP